MRVRILTTITCMSMLLMSSTCAIVHCQTLCSGDEQTIWTCEAGNKTYSVCGSKDLSSNQGYMQYRAGTGDSVQFRFPSLRQHPRGHFEHHYFASGSSLTFKNNRFLYGIEEDKSGLTSISVTLPSGTVEYIECESSSHSLTPALSRLKVFE